MVGPALLFDIETVNSRFFLIQTGKKLCWSKDLGGKENAGIF